MPADRSGFASRLRVLLLAGGLAAIVGAGLYATGALDRLESDALDLRYELRDASPPSELAVIAIDEETFSRRGEQWPFPRSLYGRAADRLHRAGAREIVFDIQFTEPTSEREDLALYRAIDRAGGAVLATSESDARGATNVLGGDANLRAVNARAAAANLAHEQDGIIRRFPRTVGLLPSLAVTVAERAGRPVPADAFEDGDAWIDFRGGPGTIPTYSFSELLRGRVPATALRGRIVVVGTSAPTLQDVHATPTSERMLMSGPEIQANAIWTALHGLPLRSAPPLLDLLAILLLGMAVPLAAVRFRLLVVALGAPVLGVAYGAATQLAFQSGTVLAVVPPLATLALATVTTVVASYLAESRERRRIALHSDVLEREVRERTRELHETEFEIVQRLGQAVESRDRETGEHIERMSRLCRRLAAAAGMPPEEVELIARASAMHDVGKLSVPDHVLRKAGPLDAEEWEVMKAHTTTGAAILAGSSSPLVRMAETIALTHHERWDGTGYPQGLAGEEIPLAGRICAICDAFDALVSTRSYKDPWPLDAVLDEIARQSGRHFDPRLVTLFVGMEAELRRELEAREGLPEPTAGRALLAPRAAAGDARA